MKRLFDFIMSFLGLLCALPVLLPVMLLVWLQDGRSPFYVAERVGRNGVPFRMVKLRSMVIDADKTGVDSTACNDDRITAVGHFIRRYKLDELTQLWNVFMGDMSLVGPRPNVKRETDLYTSEETRLLSVKPGITDFSSIVFSDEGEILKDKEDPDIAYHQLIRPGKSQLGLFYIDNRTFFVDFQLVLLTMIAVISKKNALRCLSSLMETLGAPQSLLMIASRTEPLIPSAPPGSDRIITSRDGAVVQVQTEVRLSGKRNRIACE